MIRRALAIETSCDDTSVAIVSATDENLSGVQVDVLQSANQDLVHIPFGGVVPEIASRNHTLTLLPLIENVMASGGFAWKDIDGVVVTARPGLIGSLLVGVVTAKTLAAQLGLPFIGVNHLEGHLVAPFLQDAEYQPQASYLKPYLALAVSGGHTQIYDVQTFGEYRVLGRTLDDAAGEAFDKFSKMLGLGFPGGPLVDKHAQDGKPDAFEFARPLLHDGTLNFSFSGLKTSALRVLNSMSPDEIATQKADLCASFQQAVVDVLIHKMNSALEALNHSCVTITGGVSANSLLRKEAKAWADRKGVQLLIPPMRYCTDNAAMVGFAGLVRLARGESSDQNLKPLASSLPQDFKV